MDKNNRSENEAYKTYWENGIITENNVYDQFDTQDNRYLMPIQDYFQSFNPSVETNLENPPFANEYERIEHVDPTYGEFIAPLEVSNEQVQTLPNQVYYNNLVNTDLQTCKEFKAAIKSSNILDPVRLHKNSYDSFSDKYNGYVSPRIPPYQEFLEIEEAIFNEQRNKRLPTVNGIDYPFVSKKSPIIVEPKGLSDWIDNSFSMIGQIPPKNAEVHIIDMNSKNMDGEEDEMDWILSLVSLIKNGERSGNYNCLPTRATNINLPTSPFEGPAVSLHSTKIPIIYILFRRNYVSSRMFNLLQDAGFQLFDSQNAEMVFYFNAHPISRRQYNCFN